MISDTEAWLISSVIAPGQKNGEKKLFEWIVDSTEKVINKISDANTKREIQN